MNVPGAQLVDPATRSAAADLTASLDPAPDPRRGGATVWAAIGLGWLAVAVQAVVRWVSSDTQFAPAPILGPDRFGDSRLIALRVFEVLSVGVLAWFLWFC